MDSRKFWLITTAIFLLTAVRVGTTWRVFAPVVDEPTHIAAGRMWWAGVPAWEALNPPLAKILFAIPYRSQPVEHADDRLLFPTTLVVPRAAGDGEVRPGAPLPPGRPLPWRPQILWHPRPRGPEQGLAGRMRR